MRSFHGVLVLVLQLASSATAASSWTFSDATVTTQSKGAAAGNGQKESFSPTSPLASAVTLSAADTLKIALTTLDGKSGKRPSQAFLTLQEVETGLQESFSFSVKENGKGKVEVSQKDLPYQLATASKPLKASVLLGSFGSSTPYNSHVFDIVVNVNTQAPPKAPAAAERYSSKPEIHHIFRDDPKSPPQVISLFFTLVVLAAVPLLFGGWLFLGGNVAHMGKAFGTSPVSHALFFASIVAMEGVFFLYYTAWNLFQTLPAMAVVGTVAFVSGSRALTEVQERRLAGER